MSVYPAPTTYPSIFNPALFSSFSTDTYLSTADANSTYAKLAGGQTIVAEETFSGGIKTNSIVATSTSNNVDVTNTVTQSSGIVSPLRILTPNTSSVGTTQLILGQSDAVARAMYIQYVPNGFTSAASYTNLGIAGYNPYLTLRNQCVGINNVTNPSYNLHVNGTAYVSGDMTCAGNLSFGAPVMRGTSWITATLISTNYSVTITSSTLPVLSLTDFQGQLYTFAKNGSTNSGMLNHFLVKRNSGTIAATATSTPPNNFTTLSLTTTTSNTITISTGSTASQISCLFIAAY